MTLILTIEKLNKDIKIIANVIHKGTKCIEREVFYFYTLLLLNAIK